MLEKGIMEFDDRWVINSGPLAMQISQELIPTSPIPISRMPLKFNLRIPGHSDNLPLTITKVIRVDRLEPDDNPRIKIEGICEQDILPYLCPDSKNQEISSIVIEYNLRKRTGKLVSVDIQNGSG